MMNNNNNLYNTPNIEETQKMYVILPPNLCAFKIF